MAYPYQPQPQGYYPPPAAPSTSGWAIFSLIAGVLAWLGVLALAAWLQLLPGISPRMKSAIAME